MKACKYLINMFLIFSLFVTACEKNNFDVNVPIVKPNDTIPTKDTIPEEVQTANIYIGGSTYDSVTYVRQAAYWKNGVAVILTHGTQDASVNAIAVDSNDVVYASGYITDANGAYIAAYWKNGVQVNLTNNTTNASAGSIAIAGNDVYIAGFIEDSAVYWKNGKRVTLPLLPGKGIGSSEGITIQGTDVYVSGYQLGRRASAVYWKNNIATELPNDNASYAGKNIIFSDGHMYMPATYILPSSNSTVVNYWKDGVPVSLADGITEVNAVEIAVNGPDVYLACNTSKGGGYFKNNTLTLLSENYYSEITGITVLNNDVYASGQASYQKMSVAAFWKNNVPVYLSSPIGRGGFASSIVVKPL